MDNSQPGSAYENQANRACDACRTNKVRCRVDSSGMSKTCQRCARTDRQCMFTIPPKRKQRKRTDTRVAELEQEVQAMKALFEGKASTVSGESSIQSNNEADGLTRNNSIGVEESIPPEPNVKQYSSQMPEPNRTSLEGSPLTYYPNSDVIDRGILSLETASRLFQSYNDNFVNHYPGVILSASLTAAECRRTKPTLFLAILAAAAAEADPYLYSTLNTEVLVAYAHRTVLQHEKSLELVQAMIVCTVWYYPPGTYAQLKFYEFVHVAAIMAVDIGLGRNPKDSRSLRASSMAVLEHEVLDDEELERRRTFLTCYMITTSVSMSMRRPHMLRWSSWTQECVESISHNPTIIELDKSLLCWVKLMKITEEIGTLFRLDDPGSIPDLSEARAQITMTGLEKELEKWKKETQLVGVNDALLLQYHYTQLYLHQVGLHDDHPPEDFIPPLNLTKVISIHTLPEASSSFLDASAISISSAKAALDIILKMDLRTLRVLPIANYVQTCYALVTLIKLYISSKSPSSKIGAVLDSQSMRLEYYLQVVSDKFIDAVGHEHYRSPFIFLGIIMQFRIWFEGQKNDQFFSVPDNLKSYKDVCWLPPVPKMLWNQNFEKVAPRALADAEWQWDSEQIAPSYNVDFIEVNGNGTTDVPSSNGHPEIYGTIGDDVDYGNFERIHERDFNQGMLIGDIQLQYGGGMDGWVPSPALPMLDSSLYQDDNFQWTIQR